MCLKCGKKGHFIKDCPDKEVKIVDIRYVMTDVSIIYAGSKEGYYPSKDGIT